MQNKDAYIRQLDVTVQQLRIENDNLRARIAELEQELQRLRRHEKAGLDMQGFEPLRKG